MAPAAGTVHTLRLPPHANRRGAAVSRGAKLPGFDRGKADGHVHRLARADVRVESDWTAHCICTRGARWLAADAGRYPDRRPAVRRRRRARARIGRAAPQSDRTPADSRYRIGSAATPSFVIVTGTIAPLASNLSSSMQ